MKKTLAFMLIFFFVLTFSACGSGNHSSDEEPGVDLEYYAGIGQIPECPYKLNDDPETVKTELAETAASYHGNEDGGAVIYDVSEGEKTVRIDNGKFIYCYEKEKEKNGLSYIVDLEDAYGFQQGTISTEVKRKLAAYPCVERQANAEEFYVLYGAAERTVLEYTFGKRSILFVFEDNALTATVLIDLDNWEV